MVSPTQLENGYPRDKATYYVSITAYILNMIVNIILFILFRSHKRNNKKKILSRVFYSCLLFCLIRTLLWSISIIALLMMVYDKYFESTLNDTFEILNIMGYVLQFLYDLAIGFFAQQRLIFTFNTENTNLKINETLWGIYYIIYVISAVAFNVLYIFSDGLNFDELVDIEKTVSIIWGAVAVIYNIMIICTFIKKLRKFLALGNSLGTRGNTEDEQVYKLIGKQTILMAFIVVSMVTYIIGTYICYHIMKAEDSNNLMGWHWMYFITQSLVLSSAFLTFDFHTDYYRYLCCCCYYQCNKAALKKYSKLLFSDENESPDSSTLIGLISTPAQFTQLTQLTRIPSTT